MKYLLMAGLAFLAVYICLASILAQIPAAVLAMTSVALLLILMAAHVAQAVYRIGADTAPAPDPAAGRASAHLPSASERASAHLVSAAPISAELASAHLASDVDPPLLY